MVGGEEGVSSMCELIHTIVANLSLLSFLTFSFPRRRVVGEDTYLPWSASLCVRKTGQG